MNVTVITTQPMDFGFGPDTRIEFVDADYHVDKEQASLHIKSSRTGGSGNIASFARGDWRCVIKGDCVEHPGRGTEQGLSGPAAPLTMVQGHREAASGGKRQ